MFQARNHPRRDIANAQYCEVLLQKTSRTFALNLPLLRGELYWSVLTAYLICRILDTVEDSTNGSLTTKKHLIRDFLSLLAPESSVEDIFSWVANFKAQQLDCHPDHQELALSSRQVLELFFTLSDAHQNHIRKLASTMSQGMMDFLDIFEERVQLQSHKELDLYCYYVAGTVGEFLTHCFVGTKAIKASEQTTEQEQTSLFALAVSFGKALQLVNIIKDHRDDAERNICYLPASQQPQRTVLLDDVIPLAHAHCRQAFSYIEKMKRTHIRTRLFCIWPLWLAVKTLETCEKAIREQTQSSTASAPMKITRRQLYWELFTISFISCSSLWLRSRFFNHLKKPSEGGLSHEENGRDYRSGSWWPYGRHAAECKRL